MKTRYAILTLLTVLMLVGLGCGQAADEAAEDAVKPVAVPVAALGQANEAAEAANAATRRRADSVANLLPVAVVLTEGQEVPEGIDRLSKDTFGCLDRIGYVDVSRETATDDVAYDALMTLFSIKDSTVGGLHNSLWQSDLTVDEIRGVGDQNVEVHISGETMTSGVCDDPRFKEQIEATVRQYWPKYKIFLNGTEKHWECFGDMSGMCE